MPSEEAPPAPAVARLIASPEPGWPQWRGPRRDGICLETQLLQQWPQAGPKRLWKSSGLGRGYSAPIITGGRIYLTGDVNAELRVFALDLQGRLRWQSKNGRSWKGPYPGARSICAFSDGRLYNLNAHGRVACLSADSGQELWAVDVLEQFGGQPLTWGLSECLLVDGPRLIVTPGGSKALMVALDKKTGTVVWASEPLQLGPSSSPAQERLSEPAGEFDSTSYASPILFELGGRRYLVNCSLRHVFGVDADTGQLLWTRPLKTSYSVIAATPTLVGDAIFITAPDTEGGNLFRLLPAPSPARVETVWTTSLDTCHGCLVYVDDALYGSWYRRSKGWICLDALTGKARYQIKDLAMGSVLFADQRLYCLSQEGEMALIKPTPAGFEFTGRFRLVPERAGDAWTHPVILDRKLYLRYHENLFCYEVGVGKR